MKRRLLLVLGAFALIGFLTGCASDRQFLSIGTAPTGGAFFPVGGALAQVLNDNKGDYTWEVTAEATKGTQENIRRLDSGELDLALANAAISYFAVRGEGWDRPYEIRSVMTLAPNVAMFVTRDDSIRGVADLTGKRVTVGPSGAGFKYFLEPILTAHGVGYDDFTPLPARQDSAVGMLADGSAAAVFLGGAVPTPSITQAASSQAITLVPYDPAAMQNLMQDYPFFRPATIPPETYRGQVTQFEGLDVGSMHLITTADKSDDLIYALTKILYENREQVVQRHAAGKAINPRNASRQTGTEFHPGAIRYYKEIGIWQGD